MEVRIEVADPNLPSESSVNFLSDLERMLSGLDFDTSDGEKDLAIAQAVGRVALEVQRQVELSVSFLKTEPTSRRGPTASSSRINRKRRLERRLTPPYTWCRRRWYTSRRIVRTR
jgi:hypothetical protein